MKSVWKFPLEVADVQVITVPAAARWLDARMQHGSLCLWALVDTAMPKTRATVRITGTGHERDDLLHSEYVSSFHLDGGALVFHVFAGDALPEEVTRDQS